MSAYLVESLLYDMVSSMTVSNGFNFDWSIVGDGDTRKGNRTGGTITIDFESETNSDDRGGNGSGEYIDNARVFITGKVNLAGVNTRGGDIPRETKQAYTKALDDIKTRYDSPKYLCKHGAKCRALLYKGAEFLKMEQEGKYRGLRVKCEFMVQYITQRKLIDNG